MKGKNGMYVGLVLLISPLQNLSASCLFVRGDVDGNGIVNLTDANRLSTWLTFRNVAVKIVACDVDDDNDVDDLDSEYISNYVAAGGPAPRPPFPQAGTDGNFPVFIRGDANGNGLVDGADGDYILDWLFEGGPAPCVLEAADVNDDGDVDISDPIYLNNYLYQSGPAPPPPFEDAGIAPEQLLAPVITEFMANNDSALADDHGEFSDWIEIYNPNNFTLDLYRYALADENNEWDFPHYHMAAGGYIIVFASGTSQTPPHPGPLHTDFRLDADGEDLSLRYRDGGVIQLYHPVPRQFNNVSYGIVGGVAGYFARPSPGGPYIPPPDFSVKRGLYSNSFNLTLSSSMPGAAVYYTTNGSAPLPGGTLYTGAIQISRTTTLRAIAAVGGTASAIGSHTYIFVADRMNQTKPADYPVLTERADNPNTSYTDESRIDYDMVVALTNQPAVKAAMSSAASLSIVMNVADLFGELPPNPMPPGWRPTNGIYPNSSRDTDDFERNCSVEWIDPQLGTNLQVDAIIRIFGGSTRNWWVTKKKNLRFQFMFPQQPHGPHGPGLRHDVFNGGGINVFAELVLRGMGHDSWTVDNGGSWAHRRIDALYVNEIWASETMRAMGHFSPRLRFINLYLNGLYWGVYAIQERPDEDYLASHYGGVEDDYYAVNSGVTDPLDPFTDVWNTMQSTSDYGVADSLLDLDEYIDYIIMNVFMLNLDWPGHNYWAGSRRSPLNPPLRTQNEKFKFFSWDAEWAINLRSSQPQPISMDFSGVAGGAASVYGRLRNQQPFRNRFASRLTLHSGTNGTLSIAAARGRMTNHFNSFGVVLRAEAARWGDTYPTPANHFAQWSSNTNWVRDTWLQQRGYYMFNHFNARMNLGLSNPYPAP